MHNFFEEPLGWIGTEEPTKATWAVKYFRRKVGSQIATLDDVASYIRYQGNPSPIVEAAQVAWRQAKKNKKFTDKDKHPFQARLRKITIEKINKICKSSNIDRTTFIESLVNQFEKLSKSERAIMFAMMEKEQLEERLLKVNNKIQTTQTNPPPSISPNEYIKSIMGEAVNKNADSSGRIY